MVKKADGENGDSQRIFVIGRQSELGAGLLKPRPGLFLLFVGHFQGIVPLVEIFLTNASARQKLLAPPEVVPRQIQAGLLLRVANWVFRVAICRRSASWAFFLW
jgi:hypothetical protein